MLKNRVVWTQLIDGQNPTGHGFSITLNFNHFDSFASTICRFLHWPFYWFSDYHTYLLELGPHQKSQFTENGDFLATSPNIAIYR